jgi:hypothetical protein
MNGLRHVPERNAVSACSAFEGWRLRSLANQSCMRMKGLNGSGELNRFVEPNHAVRCRTLRELTNNSDNRLSLGLCSKVAAAEC